MSAHPPDWTPQAMGHGQSVLAFLFVPLASPPKGGVSNKILWVVRLPRNGSELMVAARPATAKHDTVYLRFPANAWPGEIYPSTVDVPSPGCWHFTLRWNGNTDTLELPYA